VGDLTDQFTMMSMGVDQEHVRSDRLEEQVGKLELELDVEWTVRVHLTEDLRRALNMCTSWADRTIELRRDDNMLRARIEPIPSSSSSESNMDIHWGQGPKYPPDTCWIHWEYRQQVTPMCPVGKSWVY